MARHRTHRAGIEPGVSLNVCASMWGELNCGGGGLLALCVSGLLSVSVSARACVCTFVFFTLRANDFLCYSRVSVSLPPS